MVRRRESLPARATTRMASPCGHLQRASVASSTSNSSKQSSGFGSVSGSVAVGLAANGGQRSTSRSTARSSASKSRSACTFSPSRLANTTTPPAPGGKQLPAPAMGSTSNATESPAFSGSKRTQGSASASTRRAAVAMFCTLDATRTRAASAGTVLSKRCLAWVGKVSPAAGMARNRRWCSAVKCVTSQRPGAGMRMLYAPSVPARWGSTRTTTPPSAAWSTDSSGSRRTTSSVRPSASNTKGCPAKACKLGRPK